MNLMLYLATVLIWGSTWIALKLQLGAVPIVWSIVWRFALAALVLFAWLIARRQLRVPVRAAWALVGAQGICLFCVNFICFMNASRYVPSGLVAVVFSTSTMVSTGVSSVTTVVVEEPMETEPLMNGRVGYCLARPLVAYQAMFCSRYDTPMALIMIDMRGADRSGL